MEILIECNPGINKHPGVNMKTIDTFLKASSARHDHLCPRQVLGVRIGLAGATCLGLDIPRDDKRLLAILEMDGCFADGVEVATGCTVGHRTMRVEDYGKVAAVFVDVKTGLALRIAPALDCREKAFNYIPEEKRHYFVQLRAYQFMPDTELLTVTPVHLTTPVEWIINRPGIRVDCSICGEEIVNERETRQGDQVLCRACAGQAYYQPMPREQDMLNQGSLSISEARR
jgi:formylmethanofuran dehydrogenase subunit E